MPVLPLLVVRADGGPGIGVGHLVRCLALVQAWKDRHGEAVLVTGKAPKVWTEQFLAEGCAVADPEVLQPAADWWAIDGYHFVGADLAPTGPLLLIIDDHDGAGTGGAGADLVLDQNLGANPAHYEGARSVLSGPRYALLRRDMCAGRSSSRTRRVARRLVVMLGGSPSPEVRALGEAVATDSRLGHLDVRVLGGSDDVVSELRAADLALAAAGTVSWELCCWGVPSVLVSVAANQDALAEQLAAAGAADQAAPDAEAVIEALAALARDAERRASMAEVGPSLVDGLGARRVVCKLRAALLMLRDATHLDAQLIHEWNNDPGTRAASFSGTTISWDDHLSWLRERLERKTSASYIATDSLGSRVGLVRFDEVTPGTAETGVTIAPSRRGEGWGGALVEAGCRRWAAERGSVRVDARIKADNEASVRSFVDADFDGVTSDGPSVLRYARHLDGDERRS